MSRKDREEWEAWLTADPALRAAWDAFRGSLAGVTQSLETMETADLTELRAAADQIMDEAGEGKPRH